MFCRFCGAKFDGAVKFCGMCGKQMEVVRPPVRRSACDYVRIIVGILFLLAPVLRYVFVPLNLVESTRDTIMELAMTDDLYQLNAFVSLRLWFLTFDPVFYFPACFVSAMAGIALLQNRPGATKTAVLSAAFHAVGALYALVSLLLSHVAPDAMYALFHSVDDIDVDFAMLFRENPDGMAALFKGAWIQLITGVLLIAAALVYKHRQKKKEQKKVAALSRVSMIPAVMGLLWSGWYATYRCVEQFGLEAMSSYDCANYVVDNAFKLPSLIALTLVLILGLLMKGRHYKKILPAVGGCLLVLAALLYIPTQAELHSGEYAVEFYPMMERFTVFNYLMAAMVLIACGCWIYATISGRMTWRTQIILGISVAVSPAISCIWMTVTHMPVLGIAEILSAAAVLLTVVISSVAAEKRIKKLK